MWVLVTGGAKRLGAEICLSLAEQGYAIVVHYRHSEREAEDIAAKCRSFGSQAATIQGDFSSIAATEEFIFRYLKQFSQTRALINNVGNYYVGSVLQTPIEEWLHLFQLNLNVPFLLSKALSPHLVAQQGQIINLGVSGMHRLAHTYAAAYHLAKHALLGLTLSLAKELAPQQVRVNMVSPGQLDISVDLEHDLPKLPMQRPATCSEVCRVVSFLLDPKSAYITGQNIEVAGGWGLA